MLLATPLVSALLATPLVSALAAMPPLAAGTARPVTQSLPPMIVDVSTAADISPTLLVRVIDEADAIWRAGGFTFVWRRATPEAVPFARSSEAALYLPSRLRVVIGNETGGTRDRGTPLGWIAFDDAHTPVPQIHISYENTRQLLAASSAAVGTVSQMTVVQRELLLARAMGRALAHEIGHYLLASKVHTPRGLMRGIRTAYEFFAIERTRFEIDPDERRSIAARLRGESLVVSR